MSHNAKPMFEGNSVSSFRVATVWGANISGYCRTDVITVMAAFAAVHVIRRL